ncbi:hypothetical protein [Streptacidiphilus sp. PAMC 29251]
MKQPIRNSAAQLVEQVSLPLVLVQAATDKSDQLRGIAPAIGAEA